MSAYDDITRGPDSSRFEQLVRQLAREELGGLQMSRFEASTIDRLVTQRADVVEIVDAAIKNYVQKKAGRAMHATARTEARRAMAEWMYENLGPLAAAARSLGVKFR